MSTIRAVVIIGIAEDGVTETQETLTLVSWYYSTDQCSNCSCSDGEGPVNQFDSSSNITEASSPDPISPTAGQVITDEIQLRFHLNVRDPYSESPVVFVTDLDMVLLLNLY